MRKRSEKSKENVDTVDSGIEEEPTLTVKLPKTADQFQGTGNFHLDFIELCKIMGVKEIPLIKQPRSASAKRGHWSPQRCVWIERDPEDNNSIKELIISGWKVDDLIHRVLSRTLPALSDLQCLQMSRIGLTDHAFTIIKNTVLLCMNLRLTDISLRNCRIGEEGARLIGSALSTKNSADKSLVSLNLTFNKIGDAGAMYLAQGLRFNRSLLCLSLSYNHIGDTGATHLAEVLGQFVLTHDEIVERRKLLMRVDRSSMAQSSLETPKKDEKPAPSLSGKKEESKIAKKESKVPRGPVGKLGEKDKNVNISEQETTEAFVETVNPLLEPGIVHTGGKVIHPGNRSLISLNLSGNELTEQSLKVFLLSLEVQGEDGLLRLSLNAKESVSRRLWNTTQDTGNDLC
ncbi:hypothetical protein DNTS_009669 [Danionella cerebrum]|uniref:Leucine-rich repeat-containing protein 71 n=1 Tax=Danionella cerebrum TaxID=2873325 RepID=A0A553NI41_9TELE|nr:hypothetical protein DNTS_009669 [Danionella translucida]